MPCHLSKIQGLRWQEGSLERGFLAQREIAGYHLLHRGHPLIAIFTHPLNISITSMLKPMNTRRKKNSFFHSFWTSTSRFWRKEGLLELGIYGQKDLFFWGGPSLTHRPHPTANPTILFASVPRQWWFPNHGKQTAAPLSLKIGTDESGAFS